MVPPLRDQRNVLVPGADISGPSVPCIGAGGVQRTDDGHEGDGRDGGGLHATVAVIALDGRLAVDNLRDKVAFDVKTADGRLETVRPGSLLAPGDRVEIVFGGADEAHVIVVHRQPGQPRRGAGPCRPAPSPRRRSTLG